MKRPKRDKWLRAALRLGNTLLPSVIVDNHSAPATLILPEDSVKALAAALCRVDRAARSCSCGGKLVHVGSCKRASKEESQPR